MFDFYKELAESVVLSKNMLDYFYFIKENTNSKKRCEGIEDCIEINNLFNSINGKSVINNASFTIQKGSKCAIHGRNGYGKAVLQMRGKMLISFLLFTNLIVVKLY